MKKNYIAKLLLTVVVGGVALTSCVNTLDADKYFDDRRSIESVFTDRNQSLAWLSQAFSFLKGDLADCRTKTNGYFHCFADDMYYGDRDPNFGANFPYMESYNALKLGDYDENYGWIAWQNGYKGIFQASVFIQNIDMNKAMTAEERSDYKGQARFLRAYYYWLLLRRYGPVPIMPEGGVDYTQSYQQLSIPRSTYEECTLYITSELEQAAREMKEWNRFSENADPQQMVRPTKGAALAARAIVFIYAASPLANGQLKNGHHPAGVTDNVAKLLTNKEGTKHLLSLEYDEQKWARAAAACRDVMECNANYELYHEGIHTTNNETTGYPVTITPPADGDFSEKTWPDGWQDIDPYLSYRELFNGVAPINNTELIFTRGYNAADSWHDNVDGFVTHEMPNSLFGFNSHGLTQKMVDAYYMNNGTDVPGKDSEMNGGDGSERVKGWTSSNRRDETYYVNFPPLKANVSMQYANREPRFYASVAYNGSNWWNANPDVRDHFPQIFYYRGITTTGGGSSSGETTTQNNGYQNNPYYLRTGIGCKKWVNPADWRTARDGSDYAHIVHKWEPAIRYADILLMYAEALNELTTSYQVKSWDGSATYTISRDITEMKRGIRPVRCRAGLPDYTLDEYGDVDVLRAKIKRERMIEFVGEGKRYYDLRRWMDAPIEEAKVVYGCNVLMTSNQRDEFQKIVPIYELPTVFNDKMYFWPMWVDELKRNSALSQNPGWRYND